jgi:hypothetical protein
MSDVVVKQTVTNKEDASAQAKSEIANAVRKHLETCEGGNGCTLSLMPLYPILAGEIEKRR